MTFQLLPALVAGLAGTLVMSAMMKMAASAGVTRMPPMPLVMGAMMTGEPDRARRIGTMIHYLVMGTIVFGIVYGVLFTTLESSSVVTGIALGTAHGLLVGAIGLPMMPKMHPRMTAGADGPAADTSSGTVVLSEPGFFGSRWGAMTPVGLVMGHVVYGIIVALVYGALA